MFWFSGKMEIEPLMLFHFWTLTRRLSILTPPPHLLDWLNIAEDKLFFFSSRPVCRGSSFRCIFYSCYVRFVLWYIFIYGSYILYKVFSLVLGYNLAYQTSLLPLLIPRACRRVLLGAPANERYSSLGILAISHKRDIYLYCTSTRGLRSNLNSCIKILSLIMNYVEREVLWYCTSNQFLVKPWKYA